MKLASDGSLAMGAASHHALLLREERELHESLFRRPDGIKAMFATSTLAQGMNLPSEVVIISGDSRFDPAADKMQKLEAHELLNAAGRAGRAGEGAQGFVLLVPSKVIDFDNENNKIHGHWMDLQAIFEQADQCLVIEDPIKVVLDHIHSGITESGTEAYLLSKLPLGVTAGATDPAAVLLNRSFGAYRALVAGDGDWLTSRVAAALAARSGAELPENERWIEQVAASTGFPVALLQQLITLLDAGSFSGDTSQAINALMDWLDAHPLQIMTVVRPQSLEEMFGTKYKKLPDEPSKAKVALAAIRLLWPIWLSGAPLCDLEKAFLGKATGLGKCKHARHFVSRIVPDLAFLAGLPGRLLAARMKAAGDESPIPLVMSVLGSIVREGCDSPESLAVRFDVGKTTSRVMARKHFEDIASHIAPGSPTEHFDATMNRVRQADIVSRLSDLGNLLGDPQ